MIPIALLKKMGYFLYVDYCKSLYNLDCALTVNRTRGLNMTADIFFSLMLSQLSELIPHTKSSTSETLPKPLSAVPRIIENMVYQLQEVG